MDVLQDIKEIISKQVAMPIEKLTSEMRLEEIGVESIDVIEIIFALEKKYDVAISFDASGSDLPAFETVGQIADAVSGLIAQTSRDASKSA
jgi:acyl carrier protein